MSVGWAKYDYALAPAPELAPPSRRKYSPPDVDDNRVFATVGYGVSDRCEITAQLPYAIIRNNAGDRPGYLNGLAERGAFNEHGLADVHVASKYLLNGAASSTRIALSATMDVPTGSRRGISTGSANFGVGAEWSRGVLAASAQYVVLGDRRAQGTDTSNFQMPKALHADLALDVPLSRFRKVEWITEVNTVFYHGGTRTPADNDFLVTGIRHAFGESGWGVNAAIAANLRLFQSERNSGGIDGGNLSFY
ncbi:MAG TPA: hypothetical protein VHL58_04205 [Thermoanaerobaculia bacterium]|nr:hypothetical protein [Thermoanaerobaculia bacterium]